MHKTFQFYAHIHPRAHSLPNLLAININKFSRHRKDRLMRLTVFIYLRVYVTRSNESKFKTNDNMTFQTKLNRKQLKRFNCAYWKMVFEATNGTLSYWISTRHVVCFGLVHLIILNYQIHSIEVTNQSITLHFVLEERDSVHFLEVSKRVWVLFVFFLLWKKKTKKKTKKNVDFCAIKCGAWCAFHPFCVYTFSTIV